MSSAGREYVEAAVLLGAKTCPRCGVVVLWVPCQRCGLDWTRPFPDPVEDVARKMRSER